MRALQLARALRTMGDVSVLTVGSDAADQQARTRTQVEFSTLDPMVPEICLNRGIFKRARWALDSRYLNVHGLGVPAEARNRIAALLPEYDLVWVMNSRTPNILQQWSWPNAHLDIDDVPSTYHRAVAKNGANPRQRWKAKLLQYLMKRRELRWQERFVTLSVCSNEDRRYLRGGDEMHVIPNGFERPAEEPVRAPAIEPPRIGFIGLYTYEPNRDGVQWFLKHCWPAVREALPGVRFRIIGKGTDSEDGLKGPDVDALGFVDDPAAEIATWSAMVIPIRFGGGTRIKIADAFSRKCPVVSTELGAFGYGAQDGKQLRLADTPDRFAASCVELVKERGAADAMAERAWTEFLEKWTWDAIAPRVWAAAEDCLRKSSDRN
jgi:glycosyltransferase involved in cell wall biosynthesis